MSANTENARVFDLYLRGFGEKIVPERAKQVQTAIALEAARGLVMATPVKSGRLRGNWQLTHDVPAEGFSESLKDETGSATMARASSVAQEIKPFELTWMHNGVPYAGYVNDGTPRMTGQHMLETTVARLRSWIGGLRG